MLVRLGVKDLEAADHAVHKVKSLPESLGVSTLKATYHAVHKVKRLPEFLDVGRSWCHGPGGHGSSRPQVGQ